MGPSAQTQIVQLEAWTRLPWTRRAYLDAFYVCIDAFSVHTDDGPGPMDGEGFQENYIKGPQTLHFHFLGCLCLEKRWCV
jgi:hypothetical protein